MPDQRGCIRTEADPTHAPLAGIACAVCGRGPHRNQFAKPGTMRLERVSDGAKIGKDVKDSAIEPYSVAVPFAQSILHGGKESPGAQEGRGH